MYDISKMIVDKLESIFGADSIIYRENVKAGFKENSFFIPAMNVKSTGGLNLINEVKYSCQIIYFPRYEHINDDIQATTDELVINFDKLEDKDVFNRSFNISDDALVFTFDLLGFILPKEQGEKLKTMKGSE